MYAESTLQQIRESCDIVEVIGEYIALKKSGQGFSGLCPFHSEKTPSFHVHPAKRCFHCFGCHKGGNVFTFLRLIEGISFPEAVKKLAERAGITLEHTPSSRPMAPAPKPVDENIRKALEWAAKYFHYLLTEVKEYKGALDYVTQRGLSAKTLSKFGIGVAPKGWSTLLDLMMKRGYSFGDLIAAGLVIPKENSPTQGYDRFRERIMFPIRDSKGAVIAFGGRILKDTKDQPKYINSPESPLFSKRERLYGMYENQRGIRLKGEALIVEGYMDVVGLFEKGIANAVATMGTALTEEHCRELKPLCHQVVTVFDPDAGGQDAWRRSVPLFLNHGILAKDLSLPEGQDPDEFVLKNGAEPFYALCEKAPRQLTKLLKEIAGRGPLSEEERGKVLADLAPVLVASRFWPDRALLLDNISLVLNVSLDSLRMLSEGDRHTKAAAEKAAQTPRSKAQPRRPVEPAPKPFDVLDFEFFKMALASPERFLTLPLESWQDAIRDGTLRTWLVRLAGSRDAGEFAKGLDLLIQTEPDPRLQAEASLRIVQPETKVAAKEAQAQFDELMLRIRARQRETRIRHLSAQIRLSERQGNVQEGVSLLSELKKLRSAPLE